MDKLTGVLSTVLPVLVMLGLGMIARRANLFTREGVNALKRLVTNITLPAVLLSSFATASYDAKSLLVPVVMFCVCALALPLSSLVQKPLGLTSRFTPFLCAGYEVGMLGYALFTLLCGKDSVSTLAILDIGHVLFVFTLYKALLSVRMNGRATPAAIARDLVTSPIVISILVGVLLGATGLFRALGAAGTVLTSVTDFIAGPTGAVILLTVGYDLIFSEIRWRLTARTVLARLIVSLPLMGLMMLIAPLLMGGGRITLLAVALIFLLPPPYVLPVMADDPDERAYVSSTLSVSTLVSIAVFAVMAAF